MGGFFAKAFEKIMGNKEIRIICVGLTSSGKTSFLYKIAKRENAEVYPMYHHFGWNPESVYFKNISITSFPLNKHDKIKPLHKHYYTDSDGLIFMVDSTDRERMSDTWFNDDKINKLVFGFMRKYGLYKSNINDDVTNMIYQCCRYVPQTEDGVLIPYDGTNAQEELNDVLINQALPKGVPLLVFATKQDLPDAMSMNHLKDSLGLNKIQNTERKWHLQQMNGVTGEGMDDGINWLATAIEEKGKKKVKK